MNHTDNTNNKRTAGKVFTTIALATIISASIILAPTAATATTTPTQPLTLATDNQSVNVLIRWEPMEIEPGQDTEFTLRFQDPSSTGESIRHVNYNFEIKDQKNGQTVESMTDLHSHSGTDEQPVAFDSAGSYEVVVTIIGTGIDPPFDTTKSGTARTVINVGQQVAGPSAPMADVGLGARSSCDPGQLTEGSGGASGQNTTDGTATASGSNTNASALNASTATTNTTMAGAGNQTTMSPVQLIEQACSAALVHNTQNVMAYLNSALNALRGNITTTAGT